MYKSLRDALCGTHTVYVWRLVGLGFINPTVSQWFPSPHPMEAYKYTPRCVHWTWVRGYPIIASANKNTSQKKKKDHQMVKNTCVPANYLCPGPKKWCLPGNPKWGPERLFWLEFSGPCFGSGGNSLPKIRGHYSWVLSYCPTSSTQGLGRGNTSSTPRLGKLIAIHPMEVDGLKDHFPIQKMGDGCKWSSS